MKPSEVTYSIKTAIKANRPVMMYGGPGIGKSDIARAVAEEMGYQLVDIRVSQLDPVDIRGIPAVDRALERTIWTLPSWWPRKNSKTCLFFDELNSGAPQVMAACYQIILDRALGEHKLPDDTIILAAGNNISDGGIVNVMPTPLKNRFVHIDVEVNDEEWCQWAVMHKIRPEIIALIRHKPTVLNEFDRINRGTQTEADQAEDKRKKKAVSHRDLKAFATPRTWKFVSDLMDAEPPKNIAFALYAGTVGEGAATELLAHIEIYHRLPDFNLIVKSPDTAPVPDKDEPGVLFSLATSLAVKADKKNFDAILRYTKRIPPEFAVTTVKDALMRDRGLAEAKGFNEWAKQHAGVLL